MKLLFLGYYGIMCIRPSLQLSIIIKAEYEKKKTNKHNVVKVISEQPKQPALEGPTCQKKF